MKIFACLFASCIALFLVIACKKHAITLAVDQLPQETHTGANTFGCLVNGKAFTPGGFNLYPIRQCFYQNLYGTNHPGYFFGLYGQDHRNALDFTTVAIYLDSVQIKDTGVIYLRRSMTNGQGYGEYGHYIREGTNITTYQTNESIIGELDVKHFDSVKQVISGTFWFDAESDKGDTVKITEGRFDMHYTR